MTSLNKPQINAAAHETAATAATNMAAPVENLIEHPRGTEPDKPGRRDAFYFEQKTRLPDAADGKGRGGARYGRTGTIHTPPRRYSHSGVRARGHAGRDESRAA